MQIKKWEMESESLSQTRELEGESPGALGAAARRVCGATVSNPGSATESDLTHSCWLQ